MYICSNQANGFGVDLGVVTSIIQGTRISACPLGNRFKYQENHKTGKTCIGKTRNRSMSNVLNVLDLQVNYVELATSYQTAVSYLSLMKSVTSLEDIWPCFMLWQSTSKPLFFSPCGTKKEREISRRKKHQGPTNKNTSDIDQTLP